MKLEIKDDTIYMDGVRYIKEEIEEKSDAQKFLAGEAAVHCPTESNAVQFLMLLENLGFKWQSGDSLSRGTIWGFCEGKTCYVRGEPSGDKRLAVADMNWLGITKQAIIPFTTDFLIELFEALKEEK